ncbi:Pentatricopeptide repeat [Dillenia turbinata]|uniref:Pentatricopeptide repeat n=1 Tax=Dillenia turbinata TaxID=194707 RepID=A0AAN8WA72_9MAGN
MFFRLHRGNARIRCLFVALNFLCKRNLGSFVDSRTYKKEDLVIVTKKILDYSVKGEVEQARKIFDGMVCRDIVAWNVMIKSYVENNRTSDARELFDKMPERSSVSWNSMIMGYIKERKPHMALKLFIVMPCRDVFSWTVIITGLSRVLSVEDAWRLFRQMPDPDSVSWSSIISAFQQNGLAFETLNLFKKMLLLSVQPTSHSFTSALTASADLTILSTSLQLYSQLIKRGFGSNSHVGNSAISMFIKSGSIIDAQHVFMDFPKPDIVTWNAMIMGYGLHGSGREAINSFHQMQKAHIMPDRISIYAADRILELEPSNSSALLMLIDIYSSAGKCQKALELRRHMREREAVKELGSSWVEIEGSKHSFTTRDESHPQVDHIYLTLELLSYDMSESFQYGRGRIS